VTTAKEDVPPSLAKGNIRIEICIQGKGNVVKFVVKKSAAEAPNSVKET